MINGLRVKIKEVANMAVFSTAFYDSDYEDVDEMLERAKEHPFKVPVDYDTRIRVFRDQIIPDRIHALRVLVGSGGKQDLFVNRTMKDIRNLYKRAEKEFLRVADDRTHTLYTLRVHQSIYRHRRYELRLLTQWYFNQSVEIQGIVEPTEVSAV
jgi:hypothetical protein